MVSTNVQREIYTAETQQLLKEKGLQCVCELCDCGRHHRHQGCTKITDKIKTVIQRPGLKECPTDYQCSYQTPPCNFVRKIRRPLPRLRNPNPPPMDFRTITNTEYVQHGDFKGPPKPIKLEDNHQGMSNGEFDGKTSYAVAFTNRGKPSQVKLTRPATSAIQQPKYKFSDETTHNATFMAKKAEPTTSFSELPSFMGSILYPDQKSSNLRTVNQESYQGTFAQRSTFCGPREDAIKLGTEGEYEHQTVHQATYKKHQKDLKRSAPKFQKPILKLSERVKFDATTQAQSDFPSYQRGAFPAPTKPCAPYPATINLAMNTSHDFTTTNKEKYKGQWDVNFVKVGPKDSRYTPPKETFHTTTQTMADFKPKEMTRVRLTKPVQNIPSSKVKLADETSYKTQFPKYHGLDSFKRYGDFHEQGFYLKPIQKFEGGSTTAKDFKQHNSMRPRTSFKPKQELSGTKGEISGESVYRAAYKQKETQECAYVKYLTDHNKALTPKKVVSAGV